MGLLVFGLLALSYEGRELLSEDMDHNIDLKSDLLRNMEIDAQRTIYEPIDEESKSLQQLARWDPTVKEALMQTQYTSPLTQQQVDPMQLQEEQLDDVTLNGLRRSRVIGDGDFGLSAAETEGDQAARHRKQSQAYSTAERMVASALTQTESAMSTISSLSSHNDTSESEGAGDLIGVEHVGMVVAAEIAEQEEKAKRPTAASTPLSLGNTPPRAMSSPGERFGEFVQQRPMYPSQGQPMLPSQGQPMLSPKLADTTLAQIGSSTKTQDAQQIVIQILFDILRTITNTMGYTIASTVPSVLRGYLRQEQMIPGRLGAPKQLSREVIPPFQDIKGYDANYYASLAASKDMPMWWQHSGAHVPPPWFQNNPPPNRPHLGRAAVSVPAPPFLDSPYRSTILDYWTGKRPRMIPPIPKPWPSHHMMAGPWNGEGSMKCPCPHAPQLMCDCQGIEYDATEAARQPTKEEQSDRVQEMNVKLMGAAKKVLGNFVKAPYPEMSLISLLV